MLARWHQLSKWTQWLIAVAVLISAAVIYGTYSGSFEISFDRSSSSSSSKESPELNNERTIGKPAVYARIESMTSCTSLQREFDIAYDNVDAREPGDPLREISQSYGDAAHNRMREIGCYG